MTSPTLRSQMLRHSILTHLRLPPHPELAKLRNILSAADEARYPIDRYWRVTFLLTFLAIHIGRMDAEWNLVGLFSPGVAVIGDVLFALVLAWGVITPVRLGWRVPDQAGRTSKLDAFTGPGRSGTIAGTARPHGSILAERPSALRVAAQPSPPLANDSAATGAADRTASDRGVDRPEPDLGIQLVLQYRKLGYRDLGQVGRATHRHLARADGAGGPRAVSWHKHAGRSAVPGGAGRDRGGRDFSFLVIGDPGEGDVSQHMLRDQLIELGRA